MDQLSKHDDEAGDIILYDSDRTLVWRRHGVICKQPLGPDAAERLRHESRILARLDGVAGVPRLAHDAALPDAIVLEDCGGEPLADLLQTERLTLPALLELAQQLAVIVAAVHRAGVLHKDINPANILLAGSPRRPLLIDFDLATTFADEAPAFTHHEGIAGTLAYLAPEQSGRTGRPVDQRADLYALGATLYQLAAGHPPFRSEDPLQLIRDHLALTPTAPHTLAPHLPPQLSELILRLLEKEPERRYQSAEGLAHDLAVLAAGGPPFALGACDFPRRLAPPARLAGREREIAALQAAFTRACDSAQRGILVAGAPGIGKTALINELRAVVTARQGWFVSGKYDQYQPGAAPAGRQALAALGRLLLAEPEAALAPQRERLLDALGDQAGLVTALLPEFAILLGPQTAPTPADPADADQHLHRALLELLRAVVSPQRPLVLVLDDLQWAAPASLRFIDLLLSDETLRGLLVVGAYRDAEAGPQHPLAAMQARWERLAVAPPVLRLENLAPTGLAELLEGMLRLPHDDAAALAQGLLPLSAGNPFDTVALVNALRREDVLTLDERGWRWDPVALRRHLGASNVQGTLSARIAALPGPAPQLLETMACLGGEVAPALLGAASGLDTVALEDALAPALEDGLLVWEADAGLRFRHDRVQQAARERVAPDQLPALHLALARRLAAQHASPFGHAAAAQYLAAQALLREADECRRALALFQAAATHMRRITAHDLAERYLLAALTLARRVDCGASLALLLALKQERHAELYQLGRLSDADQVYQRIAAVSSDPVQLAESAAVQICSLMLRNQARAALDLGLPLLRALGMELPGGSLGADLPQHLAHFYRWFHARDLAADIARPAPQDARRLARTRLARQLIPPALFVDPEALAWLVLEAQRSWEQDGPCPELMFRLAHANVIVVAINGDYRAGYDVLRHVLAVGQALGYTVEAWHASFLLAISAAHWFQPLEQCVTLARQAHEGLLQAGDWQVACYNYYTLIAGKLDCASRLDDCAHEVEAGLALAARAGNEFNVDIFTAYRQLLCALRGETAAPGAWNSAQDGGFDEARYLAGIAGNPLAIATYHHTRALTAAIYGDADALASHAADAMARLPVMQTFYPAALSYTLQALALAQAMHGAPDARPFLLVRFDTCRDWLAARAADAPANFSHLMRWLAAERAWAIDDAWDAAACFDTALAAAESSGRAWHRALIVERAGLFHLEHGLLRAGRQLMAEARQLYAAWGAGGKARQLEQAYGLRRAGATIAGLDRSGIGRIGGVIGISGIGGSGEPGGIGGASGIGGVSGIGSAGGPGASGGIGSAAGPRSGGNHRGAASISADSVDLLAILRASQALSSETSLEHLRSRVTELIGAMTGATSVTLALREDDDGPWLVPDGAGALLPVEQAGARGLLPLSAFRYALRTLAPLLVADATRDDRFARDPYVAGRPHCSLLVAPILSHGAARAILLLENALGQDAFSAGRLDAVMLVAGQLAVSLENAQLYAALERKVAERTAALEQANQRLALLSTTDPLTGLANRRRFNEALEAEWLRSLRPHSSLGAVMVDIDQFKLYNDHYGHQAGDACLRLVANALASGFRQGTDLVARYGGEEFAVILPGADLEAAWQVAERARLAVAALCEPHTPATHGIVTISVGVAAMTPTPDAQPEQLFGAADSALYRAKQQGRNRVERG